MLGFITLGVFAIIVAITLIWRPRYLLFLYSMSLPFFGVIAEVGLQITPVLVVSLGMLCSLSLSRWRNLCIPTVLAPYIIYVILLSITMAFFLPESVARFPPLRGEFRWISQIVVFILGLSPILFIVNTKASSEDLRRMVEVFIWTTLILAISGFVQLYVYRMTGKDLFPINMFAPGQEEDDLRSALSRISESLKVLRMSALGGGEPKHFGYTCVVAFNLLFLHWMYFSRGRFFAGVKTILSAGLLIACVFLTLSTQAYLLLGLNVLLLGVVLILTIGLKKRRVLLLMIILIAGSAMILKNAYTSSLIEARIYERLGETGAVEDFNVTILNFLKENPKYSIFGTGLGNVHFFAFDYIPKEFKYYMKDSVFVAKAGLLRIISEQGFVGLFFFLLILVYLGIKLNDRNVMIPQEWKYLGFYFLVITISNFMISSDSSPYYIFSIAICFALIATRQRTTT